MPKVTKQSPRRKPKKVGIARRIKPIGFAKEEGYKVSVYGRSGSGKTTLWATFPKPILAIICSGGNKPGELRSINTPRYRKQIKQLVIQESGDVGQVVAHQNRAKEFATVVLDHATGLQGQVLKEVLGVEKLPQQGSWGMASQQDWGQCAMQTKELLNALINLNCHVVIVAQEREFNVDDDRALILPYVASALTPSVSGWLNTACDYICQTFIRPVMVEKQLKVGKKVNKIKKRGEGVEYCLRTGPSDVYTTKFRVPKGTPLPDAIVDPSYEKIRAIIEQGG